MGKRRPLNELMKVEPYRIFFPLGWIYGLWGVGLWVPFGFGWSHFYPGPLHAFVMMGGFLMAFSCGFLMTAIPRFTRTSDAEVKDKALVLTPLLILPIVSAITDSLVWIQLVLVSVLIALARFLFSRIRNRQNDPPAAFAFVGLGLGMAFVGLVVQILGELGFIKDSWVALGRLFFLQGFMQSLVLGVGSRLVPALLGWMPMMQIPQTWLESKRRLWLMFGALAVLYVSSFVLEWASVFQFGGIIGRLVRALIATYIAVTYWRVYLFPANRTKLAWGLWGATWFILFGLWGSAVWPAYSIHFLHLTFISGLGLMTLMVATRVVLAHGGYNLLLERKLTSLLAVAGLMGAAALTRLSAGLWPRLYMSHLAYAASTWVVALLLWGVTVGRRVRGANG